MGDQPEFERFLQALGYRYWDESRHPAYRLFLAAEKATEHGVTTPGDVSDAQSPALQAGSDGSTAAALMTQGLVDLPGTAKA